MTDGFDDGFLLGASDGDLVGFTEGFEDGLLLGLPDGLAGSLGAGDFVGAGVGVGPGVGSAVGAGVSPMKGINSWQKSHALGHLFFTFPEQ